MSTDNSFVVLPTGKNTYIADGISKCLGVETGQIKPSDFSDGHFIRRVIKTIRRRPVYLAQTHIPEKPYSMLMELGQMINASMQASAERITVVAPRPVGDRQDRLNEAGEPIEVQLVAQALEAWGMNGLISIRPHFAQYGAVIRRPTLPLSALPLFGYHLKKNVDNPKEVCFVAADGGAEKETILFMEMMGSSHYASVLQDRDPTKKGVGGKTAYMVSGREHIEGRHCVFIEDIVQSAETACNAAEAVMQVGAKSVSLYAPHLGLSGKAAEFIRDSPLIRIVGLDTVYHEDEKMKEQFPKITVLTGIPMLADVILRDYKGESTRLFACLDRNSLRREPDKTFRMVERVYSTAKTLDYHPENTNDMLMKQRVEELLK